MAQCEGFLRQEMESDLKKWMPVGGRFYIE